MKWVLKAGGRNLRLTVAQRAGRVTMTVMEEWPGGRETTVFPLDQKTARAIGNEFLVQADRVDTFNKPAQN